MYFESKQYNWTILVFSMTYNIVIMAFSCGYYERYIKPFWEPRINDDWIIMQLLFMLLVPLLFAQPLKLLFPRKKIESLVYSKEDVRKYRLNILYFVIGFLGLIALCLYL